MFEAEKEIESCIVPAWHPATLEKINDQKIFFLDGCGEWWNEAQEKEKITEKEISDTLSDLLQMSMLQSTLDLFPSYGQVYFGTIASYGAFSLYGRNDIKNENRLRDMIHKDAIFDDDFDKNEVSRLNDNAKMIYGVMLDYAKAFPNSADNLSIVFIDPSELQPIVAAIYKYIDARRKNNISAKVNISLRILVKPENKGGRNYLAYWMDEFFSQDENVNIHTYLNEWNSKSQLEKLLNGNNDIAFVMDILKVNNLGFVASHSNESLAPSQCRFPIVYKPTPISSTSVKRTIELSQPQFKAAYEHTQIVRYRNNMEKIPDEMYIASKEVSIDSDGQAIVHFLHEKLDDLNRNKYDRYYQADFCQAENNLKDEFAELKKQRIHLGANGTEEIKMRMPMYLTSVFEELYPDAIPFSFDGFVTKGNNLGGKGGTYYCTIVKMLLSNSVNETTIHNFASDVRNRIEALLMTTNATSWKCIDQEFRVIPPEEKRARKVYDSIVTKINENKEYACKDIFDRFCRPPYGMSEDVVVLMIAVVCANLNYCLRFRCDESLTNINSWKELVVIKDKKIDIDVVKKSAFVMVDAGAVTGKYVRFFERIQSNKSISEVISLEKILANMMAVDEIPEELETQYLLARKYLDSGKKANNEWKTCIGEIDEKLEASIEESNLYDALKGLQLVEAIPYTKIFKDNGYELDEESKNTVKELISSLKSEVEQLITPYLANMYCKSVEGVNTFRNHNTKMQNMLEELGFTNYAMQVKRRKEEELSNIDEIRSRQELRADCEKYLEESQITRYVTYVNVCLYLKSGKELQARVKKYGVALGKDAQKIQENINDRMAALEKNHDRTMQDMSDIWDDLYEVKNADDVEMLIDNIASVLQKGIPDADRLDFEELQKNLSELLNDINEIKRVTNSRNEFKKISEDMINKYEHSEFDFEVLPIIHEVISDMENNMNVREQEWINSVLTLGDKSRKAVHKWKEKTAYLPEYLSEETIEKVKMVDKEADEIISEGKIEDVLFYFDKLDDVGKLECIQKLQNRLNR